MGDFNLEPNYLCMKSFLKSNRFKGAGSCIGSILTNKNYSFQYIRSYETGVTGHHHMIYTLKTTFMNTEPKLLKYRCYKNFLLDIFEDDLTENLKVHKCRFENLPISSSSYENNMSNISH